MSKRGEAIIQALFREILDEMSRNPSFASRVEKVLITPDADAERTPPTRRKGGRRPPGALDPFAVLAQGGEQELRRRLGSLDLDQLRDIVAEHGMDTSKLAMKWKSNDRLINFIVSTVGSRAVKGHVFRTTTSGGQDLPSVPEAEGTSIHVENRVDGETDDGSPAG